MADAPPDPATVELLLRTTAMVRETMLVSPWPPELLRAMRESADRAAQLEALRLAVMANVEQGLRIADDLARAGRFEAASRVTDRASLRWDRWLRQVAELRADASASQHRADRSIIERANDELEAFAVSMREAAAVAAASAQRGLTLAVVGLAAAALLIMGRRR
jgi:hypothetical protein